jgi:hypothetical protein
MATFGRQTGGPGADGSLGMVATAVGGWHLLRCQLLHRRRLGDFVKVVGLLAIKQLQYVYIYIHTRSTLDGYFNLLINLLLSMGISTNQQNNSFFWPGI